MSTVPTLRVVSTTDTAEQLEQLGVADLPAEVQLALGDIALVAREGLLAMSVAAGMAVMQTMFDAEVTAACGPKGRHDAGRVASRHGQENGSVVLVGGGCR
jgi:putative transposase